MSESLNFSVVISAYNKGLYLKRAIDSVLSQTCQDFEILVIDDGSTDNTRQIVKSFQDNRVRYIYQDNSGLPACARNKGMKLSRGRYIALLDGDDYWHKDKLKRTKAAFERNTEVDVVYHNIAFVDQEKVVRHSSYAPFRQKMYENLLYSGNCLCPSAVTIKREVVFEDNCLFNEDKQLFTIEDYEYWLRLARQYRFFLLRDIMGYYRVTESGIMLSNIEANARNMLRLIDSHFRENVIFSSCKCFKYMEIKKRRSAVMRGAGRMYHHKFLFRESFMWYNKSFKEYFLNPKALIGILFSLLKIKIAFK